MRQTKRLALGAALMAILVFVAGCGASGPGLEKVKKAGAIVFATDDTYPPMEYRDEQTQELVGFDIELAKAVAAKLGVEAKFEPTAWDGLLTGVETNKFDAVISSMNITETRLQNADFVPYATLDQVLVVRAGTTPVTTLEKIKGLRVAVQLETTSQELAEGMGVTPTMFDSFEQAFLELKNGNADVVIVDEPVGLYYQVRDPDTYLVSGYADAPAPVGIAVNKKANDLRDAIAKALDELKADGTYGQISQKYFGKDISK